MDKLYALAEPTRRTILEMLAKEGQLSATEISDRFNVSPSAISQHLKVLREANLVLMEKRAQQRLYRINPGCHAGGGELGEADDADVGNASGCFRCCIERGTGER